MTTLAPHNQQLLDFIKQHQPINLTKMFASFEGAGETLNAFSKRLQYLKDQGWLINTGRAKHAAWTVRNDARPMHSAPRRVVAVCPAPEPARLVRPTRINKMQGSYMPAPAPVMRQGSDDHTRLPSLRQGRRVPFVAGYIPL